MKLKKYVAIFMLFAIIGCSRGIEIPNVINTDELTAKNILSSNGLIPVIQYEYSNIAEKGNVTRTNPAIGDSVDKNSRVVVYISKGPSIIYAKDARMQWRTVSSLDDKWEFNLPYIDKGTLMIPCNVSFAQKVKWKDEYNDGKIIGNASINDTFDKTVPVSAKYSKQSFKANEKQDFTLEIPLSDLNVDRPTNMHVELYAYVNDKAQDINISFTMTW